MALEECVGLIINADGSWEYDDTNYTTLPIGVGNLVSGQYRYTFSDEFLDIQSIDILDTNGVYREITPYNPQATGQSFEEAFNISTSTTPSGWPSYYDKQGDSIRLSTGPTATNVTLTNGLRVHFKRTAQVFTSAEVSTGTKVPGIASPYHMLLAYKAALPYALSYKKDRVPLFEAKIQQLTAEMLKYYSRRAKDERKVISMAGISFR